MSASQDKKRRQSERAEGVDKRSLAEREAAQKAKKERRTWTIIGIVIAVLAVIIILLNTNLLYTGTTAVTIGDDEYTNAEFQYYYYSALSNFEYNYGSYLSFLGLGVPAPAPEWGSMLSAGRAYIRDYSYMTLYPGLAIMVTVLSLNLIGDGLRDALDPKLKR